jgi:hypothetical protein
MHEATGGGGGCLHTVAASDGAEGTFGGGGEGGAGEVRVAKIWKWYLGFSNLSRVTRHYEPPDGFRHNVQLSRDAIILAGRSKLVLQCSWIQTL